MPKGWSSKNKLSLNPSNANFDAPYAPSPGSVDLPCALEIFMILVEKSLPAFEAVARIRGRAERVTFCTPKKFVSN